MTAGQAGPFPFQPEFASGDDARTFWRSQAATEGQLNRMVVWRNGISEPENGRRDQGVSELNVIWIESMNAQQGDATEEIIFYWQAVIDIHKFTGHEPSCHGAWGHPGMSESQKITVEARQTVDMRSAGAESEISQAALFVGGKMMMPNVWGVTEDEVEFQIVVLRRLRFREVFKADLEGRA